MPARPAPNPFALLEGPRALLEMSALPFAAPLLAAVPRGDGHGVFVIPGFRASDRSTYLMRRYLERKYYRTSGWDLGINLGLSGAHGVGQLMARFLEFADTTATSISIVGWSLGGLYARLIARRAPERVRQIISLGTPIRALPEHSLQYPNGRPDRRELDPELAARIREYPIAPPVPSTAIFSRSDGVVPWEYARERPGDQTDNIEVFGSHIGLGVNPAVLYLIGDRLAQAENRWRKFDPTSRRHRVALALLDPIGRYTAGLN